MTQRSDDHGHSLPPWERRVHAALVAASDDVDPSRSTPEDPSRIWAAVQGELPPQEAQEVIDAAMLDPETYAELRLALAMTRELAVAPAKPAVASRRIPRAVWYAPVLAAAAALIAVWSLRPPPDPVSAPASSYRESSPAAVKTALPPGGTLPRAAFVLEWEAVLGGRYTVSVSTEAAKLIAHVQGLRTVTFQVPEASLADIPAGAKILWRVAVVRPDGSRDKSATFVAVLE